MLPHPPQQRHISLFVRHRVTGRTRLPASRYKSVDQAIWIARATGAVLRRVGRTSREGWRFRPRQDAQMPIENAITGLYLQAGVKG